MSDTVIRVENLSKQYFLGKNGGSEGLRHAIHDLATAPLRWLKNNSNHPKPEAGANEAPGLAKKTPADFWALKDVSFEVRQGEVVGIIGRNGAGKSTLLKILSRITEPTEGRVEIYGRVASLLEVGTGFHPELTGRENIFLNGAILGMSRAEIRKKFDEIVAFAEVEKFLDTPVKRYSSGMYVRLAFAVAAHLEPEILIVDEVLAVGDAQFQKKCLGKIQEVSQSGRTVLFVSHNLSAVRKLTMRCLVMKQGRMDYFGSSETAIMHYLQARDSRQDVEHQRRTQDCLGGASFTELRFQQQPKVIQLGERIEIIATIVFQRPVRDARISLTLFTQEDVPVCSGFSAACISVPSPGRRILSISVPATSLAPGRYHCTIALGVKSGGSPVNMDAVSEVLQFEVVASATDDLVPTQWHPSWGAMQLPALEIIPML